MRRVRRVLRVLALAFLPVVTTSASLPLLQGCGGGGAECCKVCSEGKACGDSCIAKHLTCNKGGGCACDS